MDDGSLQLKLVCLDPAICRAWETHFATLPNVQIILGRFENVPGWDAIVAPGNSYGIMDGGLDEAIARYYRDRDLRDPQFGLQRMIGKVYCGELPIGCAARIPTGDAEHPYIVYAPTMRIPMDIRGTENVYLAMRAALIEVSAHRELCARPEHASVPTITSLLVPGLGMGTGRVPPDEGARQMALAYEYWLYPPEQMTWGMAVGRHKRIRGEA